MARRLLPLLLACLAAAAAAGWQGRVVAIADGDTLTVLRGRQQVKVRLYGIDCPELGQPFGRRARQRAAELAFGQTVAVRPESRDRYGRTVAWVVLPGGRTLNEILVAEGLAWHYRRYAPRAGQLAELEQQARAARRGLWQDPSPVPPWNWRRPGRATISRE